MSRCRAAYRESKLSPEELGQRRGYAENVARKSAWQFLNRTNDPRLSMLRKFAAALGVKLRDLQDE
jgi:hypothetical protein